MSNSTSMLDPIAPPVQQLLDLFSQQFADVKFADLDGRVLVEAAAKVTAQADAVARAEAALEAARAALIEGQDALTAKAQRALAYARIYAEEDAELTSRLDAISLPRTGRRLGLTREGSDLSVATGSEPAPARRRRSTREVPASSLFQGSPGPVAPAPEAMPGDC